MLLYYVPYEVCRGSSHTYSIIVAVTHFSSYTVHELFKNKKLFSTAFFFVFNFHASVRAFAARRTWGTVDEHIILLFV